MGVSSSFSLSFLTAHHEQDYYYLHFPDSQSVTQRLPQRSSGLQASSYAREQERTERKRKPAMSSENEKLAISQSLLVSSSQIFYPILCLICLLILVQRIRHRRGCFALPASGRQMDSRKSLSERPSGKETAGMAVGQQYLSNLSHDVTSFPSACDILQPLSHFTPLPSSGHLAAVLSQERHAGKKPSLTKPEMPKELSSPVSGGQMHASESHRRPSPSADEEAKSSPNDHKDLSASTPGTPISSPQSTWISSTGHGQSPSPDAPSIQKRSETTQHLKEEGESGVRTWKRVIVEYG